MTDLRPCFLADIIAHPEDDAPRLIMADWFEDQGDESRGSFIRVQCELACLPPVEYMSLQELCFHDDPKQHCFQCRPLRRRERELLARELAMWYGALNPILVPRVRPEFRRGFVEAVTLSAADWLAHADALVRAAPLREVALSDRRPSVAPDGKARWYVLSPGRALADADDVPYEIGSRLTGQIRAILPDGRCFVYYDSAALALADLSRACLAHARGLALPS